MSLLTQFISQLCGQTIRPQRSGFHGRTSGRRFQVLLEWRNQIWIGQASFLAPPFFLDATFRIIVGELRKIPLAGSHGIWFATNQPGDIHFATMAQIRPLHCRIPSPFLLGKRLIKIPHRPFNFAEYVILHPPFRQVYHNIPKLFLPGS